MAQSLDQGDVSFDLLNKMFINLQMHGPQLEIYSKEILDRSFNVFRNASQDDRLKISVRLNLLNLIELRANSWINKSADYYKSKANEVSLPFLLLKYNSLKLLFFIAWGWNIAWQLTINEQQCINDTQSGSRTWWDCKEFGEIRKAN